MLFKKPSNSDKQMANFSFLSVLLHVKRQTAGVLRITSSRLHPTQGPHNLEVPVMIKMADSSKQDAIIESDVQELSKTAAKRKYLLVDEDLDDLDHELKDNPLNKGYGQYCH